ncbi:MAG: hypothetical protein MUF54_25020, partial [Polyangiaceae bacterium]|nr:hypothetical protein [Polyangiaceae bacterium]
SSGSWLTDLWWNPNESGWGVTITHQEQILFLTFFIYRSDGTPYWVTAQLSRTTPGTGVTLPVAYSGDVYETRGTYFGVPFNPAQTLVRRVGAASFSTSDGSSATLIYSIDGVTTQKYIERQTLTNMNFSGRYLGGVLYTTYNCLSSSQNGQTIADGGYLSITHSGATVAIVASSQTGTCTFNGLYKQYGVLGKAEGQFTCSDGTRGTFGITAMQWAITGMSGVLYGRSQYCDFEGGLGGITFDHVQ